jgi:hypothetical protein
MAWDEKIVTFITPDKLLPIDLVAEFDQVATTISWQVP